MRGRALTNRIDFMNSLVLDILFEQVTREYTAFEQELMVCLERIQNFVAPLSVGRCTRPTIGYALISFHAIPMHEHWLALLGTVRYALAGLAPQRDSGAPSQNAYAPT